MLVVPSTILDPATLTVRFKSPIFGPDLTTVTAVVASVLRKDGTTTSWTFTIVSSTPAELVAQYAPQVGDITGTGVYYLGPQLQIPGGLVPTETIALFVGGPYNTSPQLEADAWIAATVRTPSLGPVKQAWVTVTAADSPHAASPFSPWLALDLSSGAVAVTLWSGTEGDAVVLADTHHNAATHNATITAPGAQRIAVGDGTFATSVTLSTSGAIARLKYQAETQHWLLW
jgi:hypothetical protein